MLATIQNRNSRAYKPFLFHLIKWDAHYRLLCTAFY